MIRNKSVCFSYFDSLFYFLGRISDESGKPSKKMLQFFKHHQKNNNESAAVCRKEFFFCCCLTRTSIGCFLCHLVTCGGHVVTIPFQLVSGSLNEWSRKGNKFSPQRSTLHSTLVTPPMMKRIESSEMKAKRNLLNVNTFFPIMLKGSYKELPSLEGNESKPTK